MKTMIAKPPLRVVCLLFLCLFLSASYAAADPVIIAHRGYSAVAPENTISSIVAAEPFAWGCEIDIRETADGEYVLMHDSTVDRTTDGTGSVSSLSFNYIRSLDAGSWKSSAYAGEQVPTLLEAVTAAMANDLKLCVEIKAASAIDMYSILAYYSEHIELHSFNWDLLQEISDLGGDFTYVAIGSGDLDAKISTLPSCIDKVSWGYSGITTSSVTTLHSMDKLLYAWTVNNSATATSLIGIGVDGIITDNPTIIDPTPPQPQDITYPCQLRDNLAAYWKFDEGLTTPTTRIAADSSGNSLDVTFSSTVSVPESWKTGTDAKVGGAIEFDGADDTSEAISGEALDVAKRGLTISTWIKLDKLPSQMSASYGSIYDSTGDAYVLYLDKGNQELRMKITANAAARPGIPQSMLDTSGWHHVVGVYDGGAGTAQIYLDGQMVDIEANGSSALFGSIGSQIATIGSSKSSNFFDGKLDEMAIWGRALGQAEIAYLYNQGQGQAIPEENVYVGAPTPVVRYDFEGNLTNRGSGGSAYDATLVSGAQGSTTYVDGIEGEQAIKTSNSSVLTDHDYINTSYQLTETGAITLWCNATSFYDFNSIFDTSDGANDWEMWINDSGTASFRIDDSTVSAQLGYENEWYHLAVTWAKRGDDVVMNIFLDGVMQDFDVGTWLDPAETLYLFGGNSGNMGANTTLDDFRVYDSLLTSDEIMAIFLQKEQPQIPGDANGDGRVDGSDVTILANNWQAGVSTNGDTDVTWEMGDFNGDGMVDGSDVTILANNWQYGVVAEAASVPEPSVMILLIFTTLFGWFARKHRTNKN